MNATLTNGTADHAATPKTKKPRKPAAPKSPKQQTAQQLLEQLASLKAAQQRAAVESALTLATQLYESLALLQSDGECPLPADSVSAVMFTLAAAEGVWRKTGWHPAE